MRKGSGRKNNKGWRRRNADMQNNASWRRNRVKKKNYGGWKSNKGWRRRSSVKGKGVGNEGWRRKRKFDERLKRKSIDWRNNADWRSNKGWRKQNGRRSIGERYNDGRTPEEKHIWAEYRLLEEEQEKLRREEERLRAQQQRTSEVCRKSDRGQNSSMCSANVKTEYIGMSPDPKGNHLETCSDKA